MLMDTFGWQYGNAGKPLQSYAVWAGIKSGQKAQLDKTIIYFYNHGKFTQGHDFDAELVYAAYEGGTGNHDKAVSHLKNAFSCKLSKEERLFGTWYQLVQLCEWLYDDSNDSRYRQLALQWARDYQAIQPMHAWAYFVEADLTDQAEDKVKALAFAQYLCPRSNRLSHFDKHLWGRSEYGILSVEDRLHPRFNVRVGNLVGDDIELLVLTGPGHSTLTVIFAFLA